MKSLAKIPVENLVAAGQALPVLELPPLDRFTLALYAAGSGDHTPFHLDIDRAKEAGLGDVIGHGMLTMAYLGRYLTEIVDQSAIKSWHVRFKAVSRPGDRIRCHGTFVRTFEEGGEHLCQLDVVATRGTGPDDVLAAGEAIIKIG